DLLRQADPHGVPELLLDVPAAPAKIVPGVRAVGKTDLLPQVDPVIPGRRHVRAGERAELPALRVQRRAFRERDHLPVSLLARFDDGAVIDHVRLVSGRRRQEEKEIVPLAGRGLGGPAGRNFGRGHVVDRDGRGVLLPPLLRIDAVEPDVVRGDEVTPLKDLQRLPGGSRLSLPRRAGDGGDRSGGERDARALHELAPGNRGQTTVSRKSVAARKSPSEDVVCPHFRLRAKSIIASQSADGSANGQGGLLAALEPGEVFPAIALQTESGDRFVAPAAEALYGFFKTTCPTSEYAWPHFDR